MVYGSWDDGDDALMVEHPRRVYYHRGRWLCMCLTFARDGRCPHLVPFLPKETVKVKEEYL